MDHLIQLILLYKQGIISLEELDDRVDRHIREANRLSDAIHDVREGDSPPEAVVEWWVREIIFVEEG